MSSEKILCCGEKVDPLSRYHVKKDKTDPRRMAYLFLILFAVNPGLPLFLVGTFFVFFGIFFHGWAAGYLARAGYEEREKILTVRGPYRLNRNPYYLAHIVMDFGFFALAGHPLLYLLYFPIIFYVYNYRWVLKEEVFLEEEFGQDYVQFKKDVPRWMIRLGFAEARGREQVFSWEIFKLNREFPRAFSHVVVWFIFFLFYLTKPIFGDLSSLLRLTIWMAYGSWLICYDIFPVNTKKISKYWLVVSGLLLVFSLYVYQSDIFSLDFVDLLPFQTLGLFFRVFGLCAGLFLLVKTVLIKREKEIFPRPMSEWLLASLSLGLVVGKVWSLWLGFLIPLTALTAAFSGILKLSRPAPAIVVTFSLVLLSTIFLA